MSGFSAEWLALRERADARARSAPLVAALRARLAADARILDLATGTGANVRHLAPLLDGNHAWTVVDHDAALLAVLPQRVPHSLALDAVRADLRDLAALPFPEHGLVTASALLDLVSATWLEALAARCAQASACVLFALSYDGRIAFQPSLPYDARVTELVNRHQRGDKGFGPALGPTAAAAAVAAFAAVGYRCETAPSDWQLGPEDSALQRALVAGWAEAATAMDPAAAGPIAAWREARSASAAATRLGVGHVDVIAWPHPRRAGARR